MSRRNETPKVNQKKRRRKSGRAGRSGNKLVFNRRTAVFLTLMFILVYFLAFRGIPFLISSNAATVTAVKESYVDEEEAKAIIIRDEHVQELSSKNLEFKVKNNEKVAKNQVIATAKLSPGSEEKGEISSYEKEKKLYQELLDNYKYYAGLDKIDEPELNKYIARLKENFPDDAGVVDDIKGDIESGVTNNEDFFQNKIDSLQKKIDNTRKKSGTGLKTYRSDITGILCHDTDGFEKTLTVKDVRNIGVKKFDETLANIEKSNIKPNGIVEKVKGFFKKEKKEAPKMKKIKIIDDSSWYALIKTNIDYKRYIEGKNYINVKIKSKDLKLPGKIINIKEDGKEMLLLVEFNESLHEVYNMREADVMLEKARYSGIKVPKSAIAQQDSQQGVYIKDVNGIVKFVPVNLDYIDNDYAIVRIELGGSIKATIDGKVEDRRALNVYDEVIKRGSLAKENTILK